MHGFRHRPSFVIYMHAITYSAIFTHLFSLQFTPKKEINVNSLSLIIAKPTIHVPKMAALKNGARQLLPIAPPHGDTVTLKVRHFLVHQSLPITETLFIVKALSLTGVFIGITHDEPEWGLCHDFLCTFVCAMESL